MAWLEALVLGLVQGITEFLPVSSDGHLLLVQNFFGWLSGKSRSGKDDLFFDVILHLGTTCAILFYEPKVDCQGCTGLQVAWTCHRGSAARDRTGGAARGRGNLAAGPVRPIFQEAS